MKALAADGSEHEFPDETPDAVVDRVMKEYAQAHPAPSSWETVKDIGRGAAHGLARGLEELPQQIPFAGMRRAVTTATAPIADTLKKYGPVEQTKKYVAPPETPYGEATERVAAAVPTAPLQPGGPITKAVTTLGIGLGEYAGEKVAEDLGLPPSAGSFVGSFFGGALSGAGAQRAARWRAGRDLPTSEQNRAAAKNAYTAIEQAGLVADPTEAQNFAAGLRADLDRNLFSPQPGGRGSVAYHAADLIERTNGDLATLMNIHSRLGSVTPAEGANYAAAQLVRDSIREWIGNLQPNQIVRGDPQYVAANWQHARDTWRVHSNLEDIENALQSAEWRRLASGRGTNLNTWRQEIRKIIDNDNKARKFSPEVRAAMEHQVEGDLARNVLRKIAAFAPHGSVSSAPTLVATALEGVGTGAAVAGLTIISHAIQRHLEESSVRQILELIRTESPLFTGPQRQARARLLPPGRTATATARGVLSAGSDSPLAEQGP